MITKPHFILNKLLLDYDPISYQCMEEWYHLKVASTEMINMFPYCNFIRHHATLADCHRA